MHTVLMPCHSGSDVPARATARVRCAFLVAGIAALAGGCAAPTGLGRTERLPEGTLPPSKEVGPPVNIQPAPLARDEYRAVRRHPSAFGPPYGPMYGPGWYGPRCFDPFFCGGGRSGFSLHHRVF